VKWARVGPEQKMAFRAGRVEARSESPLPVWVGAGGTSDRPFFWAGSGTRAGVGTSLSARPRHEDLDFQSLD